MVFEFDPNSISVLSKPLLRKHHNLFDFSKVKKPKMDQETNQRENVPVICRNGCGFYSSNATDGLCSVCYKKKTQPQENQIASNISSPLGLANMDFQKVKLGMTL